jgi:RNA polymerase sigma factor (sigma-70 family)
MYESHFEGIYDFALRTVRDPDLAAEVVRNTFTKAWDRSRKGKARHQVKAWLYSIARERASHERGRRRGRAGDHPRLEPADELAFAQPGTSGASAGEPGPHDQEAATLVWAFAAELTPKQYSLLDLHLRRGLTVDELAETLRFTKTNIFIMLYRLREGLAESVSYALLARRGRSECRELATLLSDIRHSERSPEHRRSVLEHLKTCSRCQASKRSYPSALEVFGNLALLPPRPGAQAAIWRDVSDHIHGIPVKRMARPFEPRGLLQSLREGAPARVSVPVSAVLAAGIVSIVAILVAGILIFGTGGGGAATARDPEDVHSTDRKFGDPSSDNTIDLAWTAISGVKAYSTMWSRAPIDLPDTVPDLPGSATSTTSPPLDPGTWYFHLRTQNEDGSWTSTLHIGPFEVLAASPTPKPSEAPAPSPTQTVTPPLAPAFPTAAPAPPTETPAPTPAPTATPAPPTPAPPTPTPASTVTPIITVLPTETP